MFRLEILDARSEISIAESGAYKLNSKMCSITFTVPTRTT